VSVTRQEHLLSEGRRCVYRIARLGSSDDRPGDQNPEHRT
jgi:hypothetical protein